MRGALVALCLAAICPGLLLCAQSSASASRKPAPQDKTGFVDFALRRINPHETDYGARLEARRRLWVERALRDPSFCALLAATALLAVAFAILAHQHGEKMRRELMVATLLARYHNGWVDARNRAENAISRYNALVNAANRTRGNSIEEQVPSRAEWMNEQDTNSQGPPSPAEMFLSSGYHPTSAPKNKPAARPVNEPAPDMAAQVSTLQQQLNAAADREQSLQRELENKNAKAYSAKKKAKPGRPEDFRRQTNAPRQK
jgi:hypothetical protein